MKNWINKIALLFLVAVGLTPVAKAAAFSNADLVTAVTAEYTAAQGGIVALSPTLIGLVAAATVLVLFLAWLKKGRGAR